MAKQCCLPGISEEGCIRPQQPHLLAIVKDGDILSANFQLQPKLLMDNTKTTKVGVVVAIWNKFLLANDLPINHKA